MKKDLLVTLADKNYMTQAKQLFSGVYHNAGWAGDYMLLSHEIPDEGLMWFRDKGILIKRCRPLFDRKFKGLPIVWDKFYLFTPEFRKWKNIIFLDADVIVRASMEGLTKVKGFAARNADKLENQFIKPILPAGGPGKTNAGSFNGLKNKYDLKVPAFNAGVMAFDSDIIKEGTFPELIRLSHLYGAICRQAELSILNLFFYKRFEPLPYVYNCWTDSVIHSHNIRPEKVKGIILHFIARNKPWLSENPFYKEWKNNLDKADLIDLEKIPPSTERWSEEDIDQYCLYLHKRYRLNFGRRVLWKFFKVIDRIIGLIGKRWKN